MVFLNDSALKSLASHELISNKLATAIKKELINGPFITYENLAARVEEVDEKTMETLRDDDKISLNCGEGLCIFMMYDNV